MKNQKNIRGFFKPFASDEDGAVTVDWVVGAAAGVALAMALTNSIGGAAIEHSGRAVDAMTSRGIATY